MKKAVFWIEQINHPDTCIVYALKCHTEPSSHFKKVHVHEKWPWRQLGAQLSMLRLCCVHWIPRTWVVPVHLHDQTRNKQQKKTKKKLRKIAIKRRWIWAVGGWVGGLDWRAEKQQRWRGQKFIVRQERRSADGPCSLPAASLQHQEAAYPPFPLCVLHPKNIDAD